MKEMCGLLDIILLMNKHLEFSDHYLQLDLANPKLFKHRAPAPQARPQVS
jgi:hypothetical protein